MTSLNRAGYVNPRNPIAQSFYVEEEKFELDIGQATIYKGCEQEHWRYELPYKHHSQLFLHYIEKNGQYYPKYQYDERPNLYFSIRQ